MTSEPRRGFLKMLGAFCLAPMAFLLPKKQVKLVGSSASFDLSEGDFVRIQEWVKTRKDPQHWLLCWDRVLCTSGDYRYKGVLFLFSDEPR